MNSKAIRIPPLPFARIIKHLNTGAIVNCVNALFNDFVLTFFLLHMPVLNHVINQNPSNVRDNLSDINKTWGNRNDRPGPELAARPLCNPCPSPHFLSTS